MKSINFLKWLIIPIVLLISIFGCTTDDYGNIENPNNTLHDWEIKIKQSGNYSEFTKSLSIDGEGDHSWLMNQNEMNLIEFELPEEMVIRNNLQSYPNLKIEFHALPYDQGTMNLNIQVFKDEIELENNNYVITGEKDIYLNY